jgi:hypothetical protein
VARPQLHLLPYRAGDIDRFVPRADFAAEKVAVAWSWAEGPPPGRTWTLMEFAANPARTRVLGVGGLFAAGPEGREGERLHAWALLAELTPREWAVAGALTAAALDGVERFQKPRLISATARTAIPGASMVLQKLGFAPKGAVTDERVGGDVIYQLMIREGA